MTGEYAYGEGAFGGAAPTGVSDGWQILIAFNNGAGDDVTAINSVAAPGTAGRDGVTGIPPTVGAHNVWTDVTQYVRSGTYTRGRQHELQRFETGTANITVDNTINTFAPWNTAGPFYGLMDVMRPIQIRRNWMGVTYYRYTGYVNSWGHQWPDAINNTVTLGCVEAFYLFSLANISSNLYPDQVLADGATAYYRLGDISGNVCTDSGSHGYNGLYVGAGTQGVPGALLSDVNLAYDCGVNKGGARLPGALANLFNGISAIEFTCEFWIQLGPNTPTRGNDQVFLISDPVESTAFLAVVIWNYSPTSQAGIYFQMSDGTTTLTPGGPNNSLTGPLLTYGDGVWHHIVVTRSTFLGRTYNIFLDGKQVMTLSTTAFISLASASVASIAVDPFGGALNYTVGGKLDEMAFYQSVALTPAQVANHYAIGAGLWAAEDTGTRIQSVLEVLGWPPGAENVALGQTVIAPETSSLVTTKGLSYLQTVELTEGGALFMGQNGVVVFQNRDQIVNASAAVVMTFGDGTGEFPFRPLPDLLYDDVDIWNDSIVQRSQGNPMEMQDPVSIGKYGRRTMPNRSGLLYQTDIESLYRAQYDVSTYAYPATRLERIQVRPATNQAMVPALLSLDLMECIQVHRVGMPGSPFQQNGIIERFIESWDAESGDWTMDIGMSSSDVRNYWVLGDPVFGVLDSTTKLYF